MKTISHISDLHFDRVDDRVAEGLITDLHNQRPDLVVVSGDLTQRARRKQFADARAFLDRISFPKLMVPGNHDIPLFDIFSRFISPLRRYREFISNDFNPLHLEGEELAVYGINTARSMTWKEGRIAVEQAEDIENKLCPIPNSVFKAIVTHHPFIPPPEDEGIRLVGRSVRALTIIEKCHVDLLLAGHLHHGYSGDIRPYYPKTQSSIIVVQAGTAISNRKRSEPNAYNFITLSRNEIAIEVRVWSGSQFTQSLTTSYRKKEKEWLRQA